MTGWRLDEDEKCKVVTIYNSRLICERLVFNGCSSERYAASSGVQLVPEKEEEEGQGRTGVLMAALTVTAQAKELVQYSLENGEGEVLRDGGICGSQGVQATASPEVMLGVAALGPQYDIDGLTNTFILGFDAYRPDPPVDDVDPLDWSGCYSFPHNIHFATTSKYHNPPQGQISDARDLVKLSLSASNISSTVYFNGTYMGHPKEDYNPGLTMWDGIDIARRAFSHA
ncbi:hypothetical protein N657DRAFT_634707 [Parathielavia appendiculata]|uniref:Uncharacterized protein n=1 Tax=Parathielavia appendiculata TaxID=2587402 RepID=A0AAN6Z3G7_9PEZI|nr:hypothetical protein N657DRAFT_634707 [Parathielavia appendiculata]